MKVLVMNCSPVRNGATAEIVKIVTDCLEKRHDVKNICIDDYDINFCKGCRTCHNTAKCVQNDDVGRIIGQYEWADIVISVSPSYWAEIPGQFKAFIDRCTPWCNTHDPHAKISSGKKGYSIALRTGPGMRECERIIASIEHFYGHMDIKCCDSLGLCSVEYKEDLECRREEIVEFCNRLDQMNPEHVPDAEIWDLYNENRELIGKDHVRGEQLPIDGYHLVVHVWIRNSKGDYLISQRSANRPAYPLMWECVGGSVVKGENSLLGAIREAREEVGVELKPENGKVLFTKTRKVIDGRIYNDIMDVWLFEYDGEVDLSNATTDEVAQAVWMNRSQIKELFDANMFVDTLGYFFTEVDKKRR